MTPSPLRHLMARLDGRELSPPTAWFPRLANPNKSEHANWQLLGDGEGIHGVTGLLMGAH